MASSSRIASEKLQADTQLRVDRNIKFDTLPPELKQKIESVVGTFDQTELLKIPNLYQSFNTQLEKYEQAFKLILDAYPPTDRNRSNEEILEQLSKLVFVAKRCLEETNSLQNGENQFKPRYTGSSSSQPSKSVTDVFNQYQQILVDFNQSLITIIDENWKVEKENKEAIEALNLAEQYVTLSRGRRNLATLSQFHMPGVKIDSYAEQFYFLQVDKPINPCNKQFIDEVLDIAKSKNVDMRWFQSLAHHERELIINYPSEVNLYSLQSQLNLMIDNLHRFGLDKQINCETSFYRQLDKSGRLVVDSLLGDKKEIKASIVEESLKKSLASFVANHQKIEADAKAFRHLPRWFLSMEHYEQQLFRDICKTKKIKTSEDVTKVFGFLSSKHRSIPIPANFGENTTYLYKVKKTGDKQVHVETMLETEPKLRSAHGVSRDVLEQDYQVQLRHALDNYTKVIKAQIKQKIEAHEAKYGVKPKSIPVLLQTLISPVDWAKNIIPDASLDKIKSEVAQMLDGEKMSGVEVKIISTNHPFNAAKYLMPTRSDNKACNDLLALSEKRVKEEFDYITTEASGILGQEITTKDLELMFNRVHFNATNQDPRIATLKQRLSPRFEQCYELALLTHQYKETLNSPAGTGTIKDYYGRELFLSSYEQLLMPRLGGIAYGSCVSGKDRKALEIMHSEAMNIYFKQYNKWPSFVNPTVLERQNFVKIFTQVYMTRHQPTHAGQNSPGCDAIKTPYNYLPEDICQSINNAARCDVTKLDDLLATNNELKRAGVEDGAKFSNCFGLLRTRRALKGEDLTRVNVLWTVMNLNEEITTELLAEYKAIVQNERFWQSKGVAYSLMGTSTKTPTTIDGIRQYFNNSSLNETQKLTKLILDLVATKPKSSRNDDTEKFYNMPRKLVDSENPNEAGKMLLAGLKEYRAKVEKQAPVVAAMKTSRANSPISDINHNDFVEVKAF